MARKPKVQQDRAASKRVGALRGLAPFLKPYRGQAVVTLLALMLTAGVTLALPLAVRRVVDGFGAEDALLDRYFAAALALAALLALGTGVRFYVVTRLGERVVTDIRRALFDRVIGLSPRFFEKMMTGEVISRLSTDTTLILSVIGSSVSIALRNILTLVGGLVLLVFTSAKLTGMVLLLVPVVVIPIVLLGRRQRKLSRETQDWIAVASGNAAESLQAVQTVQALTHEPASRAKFAELSELSFAATLRRIQTRAVMTVIVIFLVFSGIVGILWIGANDVRSGSMSAGELVQFLFYAVLVAGSFGALAEIWGELQRAAGATERLVELLEAEDDIQDPAAPKTLAQPVRGTIAFENLTFHYPSRPDAAALRDVTLTLHPGETVALVGPSGAGKSTMLQLLLRFYDPQSGRITLDGIDLRDMARGDFRKHMAVVAQEPVIFATSVRENIRFGRPTASDEEVEVAARAAAAHEFIVELPMGYDTEVGERGMMLSGGQKQRLAIARAMLRDAPILLLDEATSALDAQSERAVQEALERLTRDRTTLVVAHRLATVKGADRIVVFDKGAIVAIGTHEELVAAGGLYADLARLQFTAALER